MSNKHVSKENLEEALGLVAQVVPFRKGTGDKAITGMTNADGSVRPTATGKYSLSIGTNDTSVLGDLEDSVSGQIDPKMPEAAAHLSTAIGLSTKAISAGAIAAGIQNTAGVKGFYWYSFQTSSNGRTLITLSKKQSIASENNGSVFGSLSSITAVSKSDIDWQIGDYISIVNKQKYYYCTKITNIVENVTVKNGIALLGSTKTIGIEVESAPFGSYAYMFNSVSDLSNFLASPDDKTIFAVSRTKNSTTSAHTTVIRNGSIELGWGATAFGLNNTVTGTFGVAFGANNYQAGDFGLITGRDNVGVYGNLISGGWNESTGMHSALLGRELKNSADYSFLTGYGNTAKGDNNVIFGQHNTIEAGYANVLTGFENKIISGNGNAVFGGRYAGGDDTADKGNKVSGLGNLVAGFNNNLTGNFSFIQGANNISDKHYTYLLGRKLTAGREYQVVIGRNNVVDNDALFIIGNGLSSDTATPSNALTVSSSGKLTTNDLKIKNAIDAMSIKTTNDIYSSGRVTALKNFVSGGASNKVSNSYYNILVGTSNSVTCPTSSSDNHDGNALIGLENTVGSTSTRVMNTLVAGKGLVSTKSNQAVVGAYNADVAGSLIVGIGSTSGNRKNGLVVNNTSVETIDLSVNGNISQHSGTKPNVTGNYVYTSGTAITIDGNDNNVTGENITVKGNFNAVNGKNLNINSSYNNVIGTSHTVSGSHNLLMGDRNACCGGYNALFGYNIEQVHDDVEAEEHCSLGAGCETKYKGQCQLFGGKHHTIIGRSNLTAGEHQEITGAFNTAAGFYNTIAPVVLEREDGTTYDAPSNYNAVFGTSNTCKRDNNLVVGGNNTSLGGYAVIGGYHVRQIEGDTGAASFGGGNEITFSGKCNTFGGSYINITGPFNATFGLQNTNIGTGGLVAGAYNIIGTAEKPADYSSVSGYNNKIYDAYNLVTGQNNIASGKNNIVACYGNNANGSYNAVFGKSNFSNSSYNLLSGSGVSAYGSYNTLMGINVKQRDTDTSSGTLGGGNMITYSGKCNIFGGSYNTIDGEFNITAGLYDNVYGDGNIVAGSYNDIKKTNTDGSTSKVNYSASFGYNNDVSGGRSIAAGHNNKVEDTGASAFGGSNTVHSGNAYSLVTGYRVDSTSNGQLVVGQLNQIDDKFKNDVLAVGYGTTSNGIDERKTIFTVSKQSVKTSDGEYYTKPTKASDAVTLGYLTNEFNGGSGGGVNRDEVKAIIEEVLLNGAW